MTVHVSKSELEWPRYHENWNDAPINAPQPSKSFSQHVLAFFAIIICFIAFFDMFLALSCFQHVLAQIYVLLCLFTCFFVPIYVLCATCLCLDLSFLSIVWLDLHVSTLVYMLTRLDLHAQGFMPCFPLFRSFFHFILMLGLCAHMLNIISMVMLCSDLCVRVLFAIFYAQIRIRTCLHAWIHVLPCL